MGKNENVRSGVDVNGKLFCRECKKYYSHLGSHVYHAHGMLARDYKEKYELPYAMGLVTIDISKKQSEANKKYFSQKNLNTKYSFKKGHTGQRRISEHERRIILERIQEVNERKKKEQRCPVCKMYFHHVESHLYRKHQLISVKRISR